MPIWMRSKVDIWKIGEIESIRSKLVVWNFVRYFSRDGVDEMMRNARYFVILHLVNNYLHFCKEASKSNPLIVH